MPQQPIFKTSEERLPTKQLERLTTSDGTRAPLTVTAPAEDNSNRIATTAFVHNAIKNLSSQRMLSFADDGSDITLFAPKATRERAIAIGLGARAGLHGQIAFGVGMFATPGDAQVSRYQLRAVTNNGIQTSLSLDGESGSVPKGPLVVRNNTMMFYNVYVAGLSISSVDEAAAYHFQGAVRNINNSIAFVGTPVTGGVYEDVASWNSEIQLDPINTALAIIVQGEPAKLIRWVAHVETVEVGY